jgi:hypothetical protein
MIAANTKYSVNRRFIPVLLGYIGNFSQSTSLLARQRPSWTHFRDFSLDFGKGTGLVYISGPSPPQRVIIKLERGGVVKGWSFRID